MNRSLRSDGIYGCEFIVISHHPKSCDHKHCDSGNVFLICHMTSLEQMFKGLCEFMGVSPSQ